MPVAGSRTTIDARFCGVVRLLREVVNAKDRPMKEHFLKLLFLTRVTNKQKTPCHGRFLEK